MFLGFERCFGTMIFLNSLTSLLLRWLTHFPTPLLTNHPFQAFEALLRANLEFIGLIMTSRQRALDALDAELDSDGAGFDQECES